MQIVQLDCSKIKVLGEMKNVLIRVSVDSWVHQTIDILVADIPEAYGLLLSRDWSSQLNGYFSIDWLHCGFLTRENPIKSEWKGSDT